MTRCLVPEGIDSVLRVPHDPNQHGCAAACPHSRKEVRPVRTPEQRVVVRLRQARVGRAACSRCERRRGIAFATVSFAHLHTTVRLVSRIVLWHARTGLAQRTEAVATESLAVSGTTRLGLIIATQPVAADACGGCGHAQVDNRRQHSRQCRQAVRHEARFSPGPLAPALLLVIVLGRRTWRGGCQRGDAT